VSAFRINAAACPSVKSCSRRSSKLIIAGDTSRASSAVAVSIPRSYAASGLTLYLLLVPEAIPSMFAIIFPAGHDVKRHRGTVPEVTAHRLAQSGRGYVLVMSLRVVQWTTGNVGRRAARAIVDHPDLELVGCYAWSDDKAGVDVGTLVGLDPIGVVATHDVEQLLALRPDCISYNPMWPDVDEMCRLLSAGVNIASTAALITGRALGAPAVERLGEAARAGGASLFGTGVNPGFLNLFALVSAGICDRVDHVRVLESVDATGYASAETQLSVGFAHDPDDPATAARTEQASAVFGDAVALMADALGVDLDDIGFEAEYARATETMDLGFMTLPQGSVAGISGTWFGANGGRRVIECCYQWKMGWAMEPDWPLRHGYFVEVDGEPTVRSRFQILPPESWDEAGYMGLGMIMTAMPAVNAIPAVCAAAPGIVTYRDLPLVTARGYVTG
jgi:hypothetical protein